MRVLGVDTSLRSSGVAVVESQGSKLTAVEYGVVKTPAKRLISECLGRLSCGIQDILERTQPDAVAIEGVYFFKNARTSMILGEARGVVIAAAAVAKLPVYEYAPRKVKQAIVGKGSADKSQVAFMVRALLGLDETPPHDAADALAIGLAHLQASDPLKAKLFERRAV